MNLTDKQRILLAQRISDEFGGFINQELQYQIESLKDDDILDWDYYANEVDTKAIRDLVIELITVPVA